MSYRNIATDDSVGQSMVIYMEATRYGDRSEENLI